MHLCSRVAGHVHDRFLAAIGVIERRLATRREEGQGTMEYALLIAIVVVAVLTLLWLFRDTVTNLIQAAINAVENWGQQATTT